MLFEIQSDGADLQLFRSDVWLTAELKLFLSTKGNQYIITYVFFVLTSVCCTCYGSGMHVPRFDVFF